MDIEIRAVTPDEVTEVARVCGTAFGERWWPEAIEDVRQVLEFDRSLCGFDAGAMVATGGAVSFQLALPGGTQLGAGGLTLISVLPTHRRRGILRAVIARHFEDVLARGEPVSILLASESLLYGRFGYGLATHSAQLAIDRRHAALRPSAVTSGRVRLLGAEEAAQVVPELFERIRRAWPGQVSRSPSYWAMWQRDPEWMRSGWDPRVVVVHEPPGGAPGGYAPPCWRTSCGCACSTCLPRWARGATPSPAGWCWRSATRSSRPTRAASCSKADRTGPPAGRPGGPSRTCGSTWPSSLPPSSAGCASPASPAPAGWPRPARAASPVPTRCSRPTRPPGARRASSRRARRPGS